MPDDALVAIAAHDHRTGIRSDTLIADMLNLADAVAVIDKRFGRDLFTPADNDDPYATLRNHLGERAYLADILDRCASKIAYRSGASAILSRLGHRNDVPSGDLPGRT